MILKFRHHILDKAPYTHPAPIVLNMIGQSYDNLYLLNLLLTRDFGFYDNLVPYTLGNHPHAMKASMTHNPDTPCLHESISGEHRDDFLTAMGEEIA